jgi:hypothetical protein
MSVRSKRSPSHVEGAEKRLKSYHRDIFFGDCRLGFLYADDEKSVADEALDSGDRPKPKVFCVSRLRSEESWQRDRIE